MRLKSLELRGFKSFADDTVIHFDEDVIGIVGPNGSGKSNIVDAIRWVLGEQKGKELRLENMGDVLFNGTRKRKKGNVAQVTITFENTRNVLPTEYQTVSITRILYRSGESEYRLNGVTCRLKDIRSLLMDTGIGSNSYAIIALGMVDDILQNKDNARRRMFEQAAGISKYKRRKHETLLKLKSTSADLERIEDLLFEIETNLKALEKQARRTRRYVDLKELYKAQMLELAVRKTSHLRDRYQELGKQIETEKDILRQHEAGLTKKESALQQLKKENLDEEQAVGAKQRELNMLVGTIRNMENERSLKEQKIQFLQQSLKKLEHQVASNSEKCEYLREEITAKTKALQQSAKHTEALKSTLEGKAVERDRIEEKYLSAKSERDAFSDTQKELESEYIELEKAFAKQNAQIAQISDQSGVYHLELEELDKEIQERRTRIARLQKETTALDKDLREHEEQLRARKENVNSLTDRKENLRNALQTKLRTFDQKRNEADLLRDMIQKLEGYPESIKFLSKSGKWKTKAPLLSDIIYCAPEHRTKVEYLLGPYLNDFVVADMQEAADAIQLLSSAQKGKANFFILNRLPEPRPYPREIPGATPLRDFVQVDNKYAPLVEHLLGAAFLTDDSPTDAQYQKKEYAHCTLIDKPGSVFLHPERISGGSVGLFEGKKLGRVKNLEILEKETRQLEKEIGVLRQDLETIDLELQLLRSDDPEVAAEEARMALYTARQALGESTTILERLVASKDQIIQRQASSATTVEKLMKEMQGTESMLSVLKEKMHSGSALWKDADAAYGALMNAFSEASATYNESHLEFVQHMSMVENLESEIRFRSHQVEELQTQIAADKTQSESDLQSIGEIQGQIEKISSELIDHYAAKKTQEADLSGAEQQYFEMRNEIQVLEDKMRSITREKQNSQFLISQLNEEHQNIRFKLTSVSERLQIEFNTRLEDISVDEHTGIELEELEVKVDKLRNRIENFGEINPMAMQAYEEMKERFTTINDQKIDILEAKESLLETIREIEDTATRKFTEAFHEVREYFISVFRSLFTEDDSCDLLLDDPANPLESDIQIIAKPKGKRPKSLSQLSGGEKTLTATALLFALYLLKPAPFCVFDEVDAPLDDANILKFNKIVKNFSAQSQFVIVTHNKQTMAAVDIIYGVYMEEQGISRLSPVDFRFLEKTHVEELASV